MVVWGGNHRLLPFHSGADSSPEPLGRGFEALGEPVRPRRAARKARRAMAASLMRERRRAQLIQCRDGTQDQRNINAILELAAGVDVDASKKVPEEGVAKEEGGEPSAKKRRREVKNAVRGSGQYVYDEEGVRYLDCAASVSHVGHSHPRLLQAYNESHLHPLHWAGSSVDGRRGGTARSEFLAKFRPLLHPSLSEVVMVHSGSQANGLAIQLARAQTGATDVIVFEHSFHGSLSESSACSTVLKETQEPWVHALPVPDLYRGAHREKDPDASTKYFEEARAIIEARLVDGAKIAALLMEPIFTFHGMTLAQPEYMQKLVAFVRSLGAVVIVDEVQGGLGRTGTVWSYQHLGVTPDILVCSKPLSAGVPFAVVATRPELAQSLNQGLGAAIAQEGADPGPSLAVLKVVEEEKLLHNVHRVGAVLGRLLSEVGSRRKHLGQLTGRGLMVGLDLVTDRVSRTPAPALASWLLHRLREKRVLLAKEGEHGNVIYIVPPICINEEDVTEVARCLDEALAEAEMIGLEKIREGEAEERSRWEGAGGRYGDMD